MTISQTRRQGLVAAAAIATLGFPAIVRSQTSKAVRPVRAPWDSFWFGGYVAKAGLEALGYKVDEPRVMTPAVMFQALSQSDADFTMDIVMPSSAPAYAAVKDKVRLLGPTVQPGSVAGYLIDKATAEKHNIRTINDFQDPKIASLFADGIDKRARLIGPGAGFNDEKHAVADVKRLNLESTVNLVVGEYNVMMADVVARQKAGKPVFFYAWFPNVATVELLPGRDVVWLEEKDAKPELAFSDAQGCSSGKSVCNTGWSSTTYFVAGNTQWLEQNKSAASFLASVRMRLDDRVKQNMLMMRGEKRERDLARHAADWIKTNKAAFDGWVEGARSA